MADEQPPPAIDVFDDPDAPTFYVTELTGAGPSGSTDMMMTFSTLQVDFKGTGAQPYRRVKVRLVMPALAAAQGAEFVQQRVAVMVEQAKAMSDTPLGPPGPPPTAH